MLAIVALVGCKPTPEEIVKQKNTNSKLANSPRLVAETPQGNLYLIFSQPYVNRNDIEDRIYFFDTNKTVSVNSERRQGKFNVTETTVIVNGKEYVPKQ